MGGSRETAMSINTETSGLQLMEGTGILPLPIYVTTVRSDVPAAGELKLEAAIDAVFQCLEIGVQP
jgi:hypothetical protein